MRKIDNRKPKKIWGWDKETFALVGESEALPNPFEYSKWMIPPRCTLQKPPKARKNYTATWDQFADDGEGKWVNVKNT